MEHLCYNTLYLLKKVFGMYFDDTIAREITLPRELN
jgi:hypothetical protein